LFTSFALIQKTMEARKYKNEVLSYIQQVKASQSAFYESFYYNSNDLKFKSKKFIDEQLDTIDIQSIFYGKEQKLVLRIREDQCMNCIDSIFSKLIGIGNKIGIGNIIILGSYTNSNDLIRLKQIRKLPFKVYNSNVPLLKEEDNFGELPFFFLLDCNMHVNCIYSIKTESSTMTDVYLKTMKQHLDEEYDIQVPITTPKVTSINLKKKSFDLGDIEYADSAIAIAWFKNVGHKPLFLTAATTDCGCTVASFLKGPILPGDSSFISIGYDSRREGAFDRNVFVYSNAKESPVLLQIKGRIKERH